MARTLFDMKDAQPPFGLWAFGPSQTPATGRRDLMARTLFGDAQEGKG